MAVGMSMPGGLRQGRILSLTIKDKNALYTPTHTL